jgi:hypothetical protein
MRRLTPKTIEIQRHEDFSPHTEPRLRVTIGHQVINGGGVKGLRAQDGHSNHPITLGIDMVGGLPGLMLI